MSNGTPDARVFAELEGRFIEEIRAEFPRFRIVKKSKNRLSIAIDRALRILSFGGQTHYLTRYRTVIGDTLYVPDAWDRTPPLERLICLRHERVHLRQRRRYGPVGMAALYLLLPLPAGLAWFRARMEWEAYVETLRATAELCGIDAARDPALREHLVGLFVGPDYLWMWPFPAAVGRWYDEALRSIEAEPP
ncbi:MAG: hypothetical protein FJ096_16420 [Deltaproteobacteria bacterium]|nr:hypothetical protein [Deltaproteobacteria bacterium]